MPGGVVQTLDCAVESERRQPGVALANHRRELGKHPSILGTERLRAGWMNVEGGGRSVADLGDEERAGHLPQLVGETLVRRDAVLIESHVLPARSPRASPRAPR